MKETSNSKNQWMNENRPLSEIFWEAAQDYTDKECAAQLLEDTKSAVLAQKCASLGDMPVNRAEQTIKASRDWLEHITKIVEARKSANEAKLRLEYIRMRHTEWNNEEANHRAGTRL